MNKFNYQKPTTKWITYDDNKIIREKSQLVKLPLNEDQIDTIEKLISYVDYSYLGNSRKYNIRPGVGMAAIQIGKKHQIAYIHFDDNNNIEHKYLFANPKIIKESSQKIYLENGEGCLSVDCDHSGLVPRSAKITIKALDLFLEKEFVIEAEGYLAIVFQHEIDHLNGKLYYDKINKFQPYLANENWRKI
ncbi:MAG: peptide deformylase [Mycoplasmoidaceae bacterium]